MIQVRDLGLDYPSGSERVQALTGIDLDIAPGECVVLLGPSGSGKTSLLNLLGGLERPSRGTLRVGGLDLVGASDLELARYRNQRVGFVFQSFHLDGRRSALENVILPLCFGQASLARGRERARALLQRVGLGELCHRSVQRLSGGQRQRVAVARALICQPELLLADEPVGHLDDATAESVTELLIELHREQGLTMVATAHDDRLMGHAGRVLELSAGRLMADRIAEAPSRHAS
ncbi:MAG: ABC transporter ATP-binding protein [Candidatus Xenobium sp.]|nr:ABC transporter ATP-binding protein [Burkholderiales bacterium]